LLSLTRPPPTPPPFPYTPLFRSVVDHPAAAVGQERHVDAGGVAGHRLVDRVVHHLPHAVVQAGGAGAADVHAGPLADRLQALEEDRKSTRLNSSHVKISYAVFCL